MPENLSSKFIENLIQEKQNMIKNMKNLKKTKTTMLKMFESNSSAIATFTSRKQRLSYNSSTTKLRILLCQNTI